MLSERCIVDALQSVLQGASSPALPEPGCPCEANSAATSAHLLKCPGVLWPHRLRTAKTQVPQNRCLRACFGPHSLSSLRPLPRRVAASGRRAHAGQRTGEVATGRAETLCPTRPLAKSAGPRCALAPQPDAKGARRPRPASAPHKRRHSSPGMLLPGRFCGRMLCLRGAPWCRTTSSPPCGEESTPHHGLMSRDHRIQTSLEVPCILWEVATAKPVVRICA